MYDTIRLPHDQQRGRVLSLGGRVEPRKGRRCRKNGRALRFPGDKINGKYECRNERMKKYLEEMKNQIGSLEVRFVQIPREENECAYRLAKAASVEFMIVP